MRNFCKFLATSLCILGILSLTVADVPAAPTPMEQAATRIAHARVYQQNQWTLKSESEVSSETPETVGAALAALQPTWVAGLIRLNAGEKLSQQQIDDFSTIRNLVLANDNLDCKFDIVLNADQYLSATDVTQHMQEIDDLIHPDIWFFERWQQTSQHQPKLVEAAIDFAHSHNQLIGGEALSNRLPDGSDFAVVTDRKFKLKEHRITRLRQKFNIPVLVHLNENNNTKEPMIFIKKYNTAERIAYILQLAMNQKPWNYRLMYPVFFPLYPSGQAYDSIQDDSILGMILGLMEDYN